MRERGTRFISRESAVLRGFRVVFSIWKDDGFGYANIIPDKESAVYGALYICLKGSLAKLDEHEAGRLRRVNVQVERKSGEIVDATAYQAYEKYVKEELKPSQIYLNEILEGQNWEVKTDEIFLIQSKLIENSREHRALKFIDPCNGLTYYCI